MSGRPVQQKRYIGGGADAPASNVFASFWRSEITNPEKAAGNIKIAVSTALFAGAIILTRNFGDYLVPAF